MNLEDVATRIAGAAKTGEQVEAYVVRSKETEARALSGGLDKFAQAETAAVGVRVIVEHREGYAYAGSLDNDAIDFALSEARDNAVFAQPDEALTVSHPDDAAGVDPPDLDLWRDELASVPPDDKVALVLELAHATIKSDARIRTVDLADYSDSMVEAAVANSNGVTASWRRTSCWCAVDAIAGEGEGTQTGVGISIGRTYDDLKPHEAVAEAVEKATRLLGAQQIETTRLPVILSPQVAHSFMALLTTALSGDALARGRSFFAERVGEEVAAPFIDVIDDPTDAEATSAARFDGEGIPTRRLELIRRGRLQGFAHNVVSARRVGDGARTTGSAMRSYMSSPGVGFRNLHLEPGEDDLEGLMRRAGGGFYVQNVTGLHSGANPVSGDFSAGATGLLVRDGDWAEPVREVTIASTLQRMLLDVVAVGADVRQLPGGASSSLLISEMTIGGA